MSENSVHNSCVVLTVVYTWNFVLPLSANVTESAAWLEVTRPWFLLQVNCEHGRCVNRRLPCCRGMVWLHACRRATVTCVVLDRAGSQVCFFSTLCWYPCCVSVSTAQFRAHTHLYITLQRTCVSLALQLPSSFTLVVPLVPYKSCVSHFMYLCRTCVD